MIMQIRIRQTGEVTTATEYMARFPNTSFRNPIHWTAEFYEAQGIDPILEYPNPNNTPQDGVQEINGRWYKKWK